MIEQAIRDEEFADPSAAWRAFYAGNYAAAYTAARGVDVILENLASIMCGSIARGLEGLDHSPFQMPMVPLYRAYALWCLDRTAEAADCLAPLREMPLWDIAERMTAAVSGPEIDVLLMHMPNSDKAMQFDAIPGFRIIPVSLSPDAFGQDMPSVLAELPWDAHPTFALSVDATGPYLPAGFYGTGIPTVLWASDHDYFLASRYTDYATADVIIVNAADEQVEMDAIYPARVASFPGHETFRQRSAPPDSGEFSYQFDALFTGRAFVPYMADKARYLSALAMVKDPNLRISIIDGYLPESEYADILARSRYVPTFWRYHGGIQTRAIESLMAGASVMSPESFGCGRLAAGNVEVFHTVPEDEPGEAFAEFLAQPMTGISHEPQTQELFWPSPDRESRLLKFAYFQTLLAPTRDDTTDTTGAVPVELRGYGEEDGVTVYTAIANLNLGAEQKSAAHFNNAAMAAVYAAILVGSNQDMGIVALDSFAIGRAQHPRHLALAFNHACVLRLFGQHENSEEAFAVIGDVGDDWALDPRTDALLSHRIRDLATMFCYGEYYRSVAGSLSKGDIHFRPARSIIAAAVQTYLGQAALDRSDAPTAADHYRRATEHAEVYFPAWAGLTRALSGIDGQSEETYRAFSQATSLYPPLLIDLMPFGVAALEAMGGGDAAEVVGQWLRLATRTCGVDRKPKPVPAAALGVAETFRDRLGDWAFALDVLHAATPSEAS